MTSVMYEVLVVLAGSLLLPLCGCGRKLDAKTSDGRTIVAYWEKSTGFEDEAMQAVVDEFNTSQNRIFVKKLAVGEIERKVMLASSGSDPPDVAGVYTGTITGFSEKGA